MIIDTHCHLNDESFNNDYEQIINEAKDNNIKQMIVIGTNLDSCKKAVELANKFDNVYAILGIYPEYINEYNEEFENFINNNINEKIVGIGEIGLDYHYTKEFKNEQKQMLIKQLKLANSFNLPVCFHLRDAYEDFLEVILENKNLIKNGAVVHCFSGSLEYAKILINLGFKLGLDGPITFKNNKKSEEIIIELDLSNFVVETDCPYLSPEPLRGKRNEPKNLNLIVNHIAKIKNMKVSEVEDILLKNTYELYPKLKG